MAALVSCHFPPEASHSQLAWSEAVGTGVRQMAQPHSAVCVPLPVPGCTAAWHRPCQLGSCLLGCLQRSLLREFNPTFSLLPLWQKPSLCLSGLYLGQRALFVMCQGVSVKPWTAPNRCHVYTAHWKNASAKGRSRGGSSQTPSFGRAWHPPEFPSDSCVWAGKAISSLLFPVQGWQRQQWGMKTKSKQGHSSSQTQKLWGARAQQERICLYQKEIKQCLCLFWSNQHIRAAQ